MKLSARQANCFASGLFYLQDFQGRVLDLAGSVNPVITYTRNSPNSANQQWQWTIGGDAGGGAEFSILANAAVPGMAAFYDVATAGLGATYQQLTMVDPSTVNFGIAANCVNETSGSFFLSFEGNGYVLTSWAAQDGDTAAPVTLESFTGRAEQVWTSIPA